MIIGIAQIRFTDKKAKIDTVKEMAIITSISDNPLPVDWNNSQEVEINTSDLNKTPIANIPFSELPLAASKAKNFSSWEKDLSSWLFRTQRVHLFQSSRFNELSKLGETERDFKVRLHQVAREKRDEQVEKLRKKYAVTFTRLDERIRRAQMVLEEQQAQAKGQKYQVAVSLGETLLSSFLGRKSGTRASRATREIARTMKESRDRKSAEANLKALRQEREKLEAQFKSETDSIEVHFDPVAEAVDKIAIAPIKTNISVQTVALVWVMV